MRVEPEQLIHLTIGMFALFWFLLGASIGSFLNVVVYRLPRGMSLSHPPSRCPACRHRIRWRDNVPVLGWFALGGRCRDCDYPISPRYPFVEFLVGLVFLILAVAQLTSGGANLPFRPLEPGLRDLRFPSPPLTALTLIHAILFTCLIAMLLIDQDRQPIPTGVYALPLLLLPLAEWLHPAGALIGLGVGLLVGMVVGWVYSGWNRGQGWAPVVGFLVIGGYLGWTGMMVALGVTLISWGAMRLAAPELRGRYPISPLTPATLAAFLYLLNWKWLVP